VHVNPQIARLITSLLVRLTRRIWCWAAEHVQPLIVLCYVFVWSASLMKPANAFGFAGVHAVQDCYCRHVRCWRETTASRPCGLLHIAEASGHQCGSEKMICFVLAL
jgi:hypothetical protein